MAKVVFIETNFSGLDAILYCKRMGYHTVLVSDSYDRFKKWFPESVMSILDEVDQVIEVSDSDSFDEVQDVLNSQVGTFEAILTFAEIRICAAAKLARSFGLRSADPESIKLAQDKFMFRQILKEMYVDDVWCRKIDSAEELSKIKRRLSYPCFIKPVQGHSSIGALVCKTIDDVDDIVQQLTGIKEDWISKEFVVEQYLEGDLYSVEALTVRKGRHQIVGVSDRDVIHGCVEVGSSFPLVNSLREKIEKKACAALDAIDYEFGPSHIEMIVVDGEPHLVEINARVGGSGHSIMLALSASRSIVGDYVELCLGTLEETENLYKPVQGAAWKCFVAKTPGTIKYLPSEAEVKALHNVEQYWIHREVGSSVDVSNSNYSWIAQVMCSGRDHLDAKRNAQNAIDFIAANTIIQ